MAQQNEQNHSLNPATVTTKRKRGRPRKEDSPGTKPSGQTQRRRRNPPPPTTTMSQDLVGQPVSGILDGVFDAGFLITVRVSNNGPVLKGMVFDSRLSVPISAANDVAPHLKMSKRDEIPIPSVPISAEPLQRGEPPVLPRIGNRVSYNDGSTGSASRSKGSEAVILGVQSTVSKESPVAVKVADDRRQELTGGSMLDAGIKAAAPVTIQVPGNQKQVLTGASKLDSTRKTLPSGETASDLKVDNAIQMSPLPLASESDTKEGKPHEDSDQPKTSAPRAAASSATSETLQEIKTNPIPSTHAA